MKILSVVGARPNFMKIAPFIREIDAYNHLHNGGIELVLVHTGQHYDDRMNRTFFDSLGIPEPHINLGVGSGSHAEQLGRTMIAFEKVLLEEIPDWVVVVGDVNATLACSVIARRLGVRVCHIEAGLRSGDMSMPEEINRLVTDRMSDLLLTPDRLSSENLLREGIPEEKIRFVGNIMIDSLETCLQKAASLKISEILKDNLVAGQAFPEDPSLLTTNIPECPYVVVTLHRPSNVDHPEILKDITDFLISEVAAVLPVIWPVHPRTQKMLKEFGLWKRILSSMNIYVLLPVGYLEMLRLNLSASLMLTDSGGLQEECCVLGTPCLTIRPNTERPVTLREHGGTGVLTGNLIGRIRQEYRQFRSESPDLPNDDFCPGKPGSLNGRHRKIPRRPELWDGHTAPRCLNAILSFDREFPVLNPSQSIACLR